MALVDAVDEGSREFENGDIDALQAEPLGHSCMRSGVEEVISCAREVRECVPAGSG